MILYLYSTFYSNSTSMAPGIFHSTIRKAALDMFYLPPHTRLLSPLEIYDRQIFKHQICLLDNSKSQF